MARAKAELCQLRWRGQREFAGYEHLTRIKAAFAGFTYVDLVLIQPA